MREWNYGLTRKRSPCSWVLPSSFHHSVLNHKNKSKERNSDTELTEIQLSCNYRILQKGQILPRVICFCLIWKLSLLCTDSGHDSPSQEINPSLFLPWCHFPNQIPKTQPVPVTPQSNTEHYHTMVVVLCAVSWTARVAHCDIIISRDSLQIISLVFLLSHTFCQWSASPSLHVQDFITAVLKDASTVWTVSVFHSAIHSQEVWAGKCLLCHNASPSQAIRHWYGQQPLTCQQSNQREIPQDFVLWF